MKKKIFFSLIALVLFFLILEVVFRILFFVNLKKYNTTPFIQGSSLQMADDNLIYRNRPFYLDKNKKHQFNEEGFKSNAGDTKMPEKKPSDFWVFLFGASAMEGMGSNKDGEWLDITGVRDYSYQESIASLLQQQLQSKIQDKKVRVFCAANSGFSVYQSMLQYKRLKEKYKMDWVISLDGNNEPLFADSNISSRQYLENDWKEAPIFKSPLKYIIPITQRSAFVNSLKQTLFEMKTKKRLENAASKGFPARAKWLSNTTGHLNYNGDSLTIQRSTDSFFYYYQQFENELNTDNTPHLFFIQPHLSLIDTLRCSPIEKSLLNYYKSIPLNSGNFNSFIRKIHEEGSKPGKYKNIVSLSFMHNNGFETFVDYCHFSALANKQLSVLFADSIISKLYSKPRP